MDRWFDERRHDEIRRELKQNRRRLRALAQACCPKDGRVLGAVCWMSDGCWLWCLGERMTFEQAKREALAMAAMEYETAIEAGMDSHEAWDHVVLPDSDHVDRIRHFPQHDRLIPLEDPLHFYQSSSQEQLRGRLPGGEFSTCPHCKLTYLIEPTVMAYAAGWAMHANASKPVIVHPGRVMTVGPDDRGPAFGLDHSWRPTPWTILGLNTPTPPDGPGHAPPMA